MLDGISVIHGKQSLKIIENYIVLLNRMLNSDVKRDVKSPAVWRGLKRLRLVRFMRPRF